VLRVMRVVADFLIVIGAMLLTGATGMIAIGVGHVSGEEEPLMVFSLMFAILGAGMFTAGILVHLRRSQRN
jgi:hypothetical protein